MCRFVVPYMKKKGWSARKTGSRTGIDFVPFRRQSRGGFGSFLVDLHEGLVFDLSDPQHSFLPSHAGEISRRRECIRHSHFLKGGNEIIP